MFKNVKVMELGEKFNAPVLRVEKHLNDTKVGLRKLHQAITLLPTYLNEYKNTQKFVKENKK